MEALDEQQRFEQGVLSRELPLLGVELDDLSTPCYDDGSES